ncbi:MAG: enoyl-CoA hydratase-related protein [Desulfarculaceae bacterium]|jgi:enoyl-CoA hydratase/carnithine racemase
MSYENLVLEKGEDHVGIITLNRPDRLNTFTSQTATEVQKALLEMESDPEVRVILLRGEGKAFCAGIDVTEMEGLSPNQLKSWVEHMETPLVTMSKLCKPVMVSVRGVAAANGGGLVAAADLAIVSSKARIGFTAVNVGLFCLGPAVPLFRMVGRKRALELLFYGELINADKAYEMGLVNKVVPEEDLDQEAREWAAKLAAKSPVAVQLSKRALYATADMDYVSSFDFMNEAFARLCTTEDAKEGVAAFLEKRDPQWKGC